MPEISENEIKEAMKKYEDKIKSRLETQKVIEEKPQQTSTREYLQFKQEYMPKHMTLYENACNYCAKLIKIAPDKKTAEGLSESIKVCHLDITPTGVYSFSILVPPLACLLLGLLFALISKSNFLIMGFFFIGLILILPFQKIPNMLANNWRMKASNQMVLSIFYIVTYMRHTSNLERAIDFAAEHLSPPLSLDLKKVLWDVETSKFESIKESLDYYLESWKKWNMEYIEAMHLIEGSLYEGSEDRRLNLLDKALEVMLNETYEKMLHYAHNLKSPITMLHMLGIILPILGLVILPLVVSFMEVKWFHLAILYDLLLPIIVYYLGMSILSSRPTGYGDTDISEENPELKKYKSAIIRFGGFEVRLSPLMICTLIGAALIFISLVPIIMYYTLPDPVHFDIPLDSDKKFWLLEYRASKTFEGEVVGPFGIGASALSIFFVLGLGFSLGLYFKFKSKNVIQIRNKSKELEKEFASALFQLGNRLGDGLPAEMAFEKVASSMEGTVSGSFCELVSQNIHRLGMSVEAAIFDPKHGALVYFPSSMIESSMKVLSESIKKGPRVAAQALINISQYINQIHTVNERLKDLMADIISSMKSQIKFMAPVIAGIVIGITSMVTSIIGKLSAQMATIAASNEASSGAMGGGGAGSLINMFGDGVPTYYFQIIVGIYVIEIVYILTVLANGIENGSDKLNEKYELGVNLTYSTVLYCAVALIVMVLFNMIAGQIINAQLG